MNLLTMFSGGGGFDLGARKAGLIPTVAIEYDPKIAEYYRKNLGDHVVIGRVQDVDYGQYKELIQWVHSSPECTEFSQGKNGKGVEGEEEISQAEATCRAISDILPSRFTLENVWGYRKSDGWTKLISETLKKYGYWYTVDHVDFSKLGVPQKRKRMIVRAIRSSFVPLLAVNLPIISWYDAIEDLIPDLEEGELPNWLIERLNEYNMAEFPLLMPKDADTSHKPLGASAPAYTMSVSQSPGKINILLSGTNSKSNGKKHFLENVAAPTVTADGCVFYLLHGENTSNKRQLTPSDKPSKTIRGGRTQSSLTISPYRVLKANIKCFARWQSFPDDYILPTGKTLATKIIGNSVPPEGAYHIVRSLL